MRFIAERLNIPKLLVLRHPEGEEEWSAMDICDAFAAKRGFYTAKASRPDSYRAANSILRMTLDGKICLSLKPRGYNVKRQFWEKHHELDAIKAVQALGVAEAKNIAKDFCSDSENELEYTPANQQVKQSSSRRNDVAEADGDDEESEEEEAPGVSNPFDLLNDDDE